MNARQIEIFRTIMLSGTITGAAQLLRVSVPAISRALSRLEDELGYALFDRRQNRLVPTPEALELYQAADAAVRGLDRVNQLAAALRQGEDQISVAASPAFATSILPAAIARLRRSFPQTRVECATTSQTLLVENLLLRKAAFGLAQFPSGHPMLFEEKLASLPMKVAVPRDWPLARRVTARLEDLIALPLIGFANDTVIGETIDAHCRERGIALTIAAEVRYTMIACHFVEQGLGVAIVDPFVISPATRWTFAVLDLEDAPQTHARLVRLRDRPMSHLAQTFSAELARSLQALGP